MSIIFQRINVPLFFGRFAISSFMNRWFQKIRWATLEELFGIDLRALGVFRICLGILLLLDLSVRLTSLEAHYTDLGALPRTLIYKQSGHIINWSVYFLSGRWQVQAALFAIQMLIAFCFLIGYRTWLANAASWYLLAALYIRNYLVLQGGDILLLLLVFWSLFLPLGARYSVDAWRSGATPPTPVTQRILSGGSAALLLQVVFVYWFAVAFKWNRDWLSGEAVYFALHLDSFATALGVWLRQFYPFLIVMSYVTLALEAICPTIVFSPIATSTCRIIGVGLALLMHLGFDLGLSLGLFAYTSMTSWLVFLPSEFWNWVEYRLGRKSPPVTLPPKRDIWLINAIALFLILYVFAWNMRTLNYGAFAKYYPKHFNSIGRALRLEQTWNMFYIPLKEDGWYVIPAELADGRVVDLFQSGAPLSWEKPKLVSDTYIDQRWRKYLSNVSGLRTAVYLPDFARYLCGNWDRSHPPGEQVKNLQIVFMRNYILSGNKRSPTQKVVLWNESCKSSEKDGEDASD